MTETWGSAARGMKDQALDALAGEFNVAQFASFGPGPEPQARFLRVRGTPEGTNLDVEQAAATLLGASRTGTVNVRSFHPDHPKGNPFEYGLHRADDVGALVRRFTGEGLFVIVNETIDVADGGVSGVRAGGVTEFAPGGTPRVVEEQGICSVEDTIADRLFATVYRVRLPFPDDPDLRIEFSVHPVPVGFRRERCVVWEVDRIEGLSLEAALRWPNRFSRHVGDKAFGLLMAASVGLPVPRTEVLARRIAPFHFGEASGSDDIWVRTCPAVFSPGRFPTVHGWTDPFALLVDADPDGTAIASVLVQEGVAAGWSGAGRSAPDGPIIEGVPGEGDDFMLGLAAPSSLPPGVATQVADLVAAAETSFGPVRIEWAADDAGPWVLQLNQANEAVPVPLNAGVASFWLAYDPAGGLDALHQLVEEAARSHAGIEVIHPVGLTSHVGDVLRDSGVPARMAN